MNKYKFFSKLVNFLVEGQTIAGGWGNEPGPRKEANPLNTSEVLLGLILASDHLVNINSPSNLKISIEKGIKYLIQTQLSSGGWSTGGAYLVKQITAQGNIVSTCISLWAIIEYLKRYPVSEELENVVKKGYFFVCNCIEMDNCIYSPNLKSVSTVAAAYCLLALCIISESSLIKDNLIDKISQVVNIIKCDFTEDIECKEVIALLSFIAIKLLNNKIELIKHISVFYKSLEKYIKNLNVDVITSTVIEKQVVREIGKAKRDFNHYMPFWYSIALLRYPNVMKTEQLAYAFYKLNENIDMEEDGGVILGGKGLTWTTGQTLMAYCYYFDTIDVDKILKLEGFNMADCKNVFVVYGRNLNFKSKIFEYLRLIGLNPLEWESIIPYGAPFTFNVVENGLKQARACLILLTGDDEAKCIDEYILPNDADYEKKLTPQPRLNVVFEAGMAFTLYKERTIIVKLGGQRNFSDIDGMNYINLNNIYDANDGVFKTQLNNRLRKCGCEIDLEKRSEWINFKF